MPTDASGLLLLLDTHVWLWHFTGVSTRLSRRVVQQIELAVDDGRCLGSVMSVWELAMLTANGRMDMGGDVASWVAATRQPPGVTLAPLTPEIAIAANRLPDDFHGDPADRILVATARAEHAVLVTCDAQLLAYGARGHVRVLDARP